MRKTAKQVGDVVATGAGVVEEPTEKVRGAARPAKRSARRDAAKAKKKTAARGGKARA